MDKFEATLQRAAKLQGELLAELRGEHPDTQATQKAVAADIAFQLGQMYNAQRKLDQVGNPRSQGIFEGVRFILVCTFKACIAFSTG